MHIELDSIWCLGNDERIQGTFKRPLGIDAAGIISLIQKTAKMLPAALDGLDIPLSIQNIVPRCYQCAQTFLIIMHLIWGATQNPLPCNGNTRRI